MGQQYDIVVIGAGSGGLTAAVGFSRAGKKVLLIEREHMGGECTNTGCIPSKALLHHAKEYYLAKKISGETGLSETYRTNAFTYVRNIVDSILAKENPETFKNMGIDVVIGEAAFVSKCAVVVDETTYTYKTAIIASGSSPRMIDIPGLDAAHILTNQTIFSLTDVPERLLLIGGGPIGMEMAQAFAMLGSNVTIVEQNGTFAGLEDEALQPIIKQSFEKLGITIETKAVIQKVEGTTAHFDVMADDSAARQFTSDFDKVLIAIGRTPNIPKGLEHASIQHSAHGVTVDSQYRTTNKYVYALGDVAQTNKFTHMADDVARQVVTRVISRGLVRVSDKKSVPKVTYTKPEIAQVGMSWQQAQAAYSENQLMRIEVPFTHNDRATTDDATEGMLVVIAKRLSGKILGAHIAGPAAGDIVTICTLAIDERISLWKLQKLIFAYPTYSLIIKKAADQFVGRQIGDITTDIKNTLKRQLPKIVALTIWIAALFAFTTYQNNQGLSNTDAAIVLFDFIALTTWGPLVYILAYAIRPITFFPATALTILAGIFYGLVWGTLFTIIAATLAAGVAYGVGRFFGSNIRYQKSIIGNWVRALREHTFASILTMRLMFVPFDLLSYAAGILRVQFIPFILATCIGIILGTATFVSIGASLNVEEFKQNGFTIDLFEPQFLLLSAIIFALSLGVSKILKQFRKTK